MNNTNDRQQVGLSTQQHDAKDKLPAVTPENVARSPNGTRRVIFPSLYSLSPSSVTSSPSLGESPNDNNGRITEKSSPSVNKQAEQKSFPPFPVLKEEDIQEMTSSSVMSHSSVSTQCQQQCLPDRHVNALAPRMEEPRQQEDLASNNNELSGSSEQQEAGSSVPPQPVLPDLSIPSEAAKHNNLKKEVTFNLPEHMSMTLGNRRLSLPEALGPWFHQGITAEETHSPTMPLRSILRPSRSYSSGSEEDAEGTKRVVEDDQEVCKISSIESDIPSLASSSTSQSFEEQQGVIVTPTQAPRPMKPRSASMSDPCCRRKIISFDPHVWVREFERSAKERERIWYSPEEMEAFKMEAIQRIVEYTEETQLVPTGTGRVITSRRCRQAGSKAFFSHQALQVDAAAEEEKRNNRFLCDAIVKNEIRSILVVDPQDICLKLFSKSLKSLMPHVDITLATSSEEAIQHISQDTARRFDLILIEERLQDSCASGSALLRRLVPVLDKSLFIGVSAHWHEDVTRMEDSGADFCWPKPPPGMNQKLLHDLLKALLLKRGRATIVKELFG